MTIENWKFSWFSQHQQDALSITHTPCSRRACGQCGQVNSKAYFKGLGNIGALASMPVMEGKSVLFKTFAGVDAFPIRLDTTDVEKVIETVKLLEPSGAYSIPISSQK